MDKVKVVAALRGREGQMAGELGTKEAAEWLLGKYRGSRVKFVDLDEERQKGYLEQAEILIRQMRRAEALSQGGSP
jgi:hypothetical protein